MRVMPMMWIIIAHISNPRRRYSTGVRISIPFKTQKMLAPGQHLAQLGIVVRDHSALAQLIEEPAKPEAAHPDHRGGVIDVTHERQPVTRDLPGARDFELWRDQPEQVDETHCDQQPGHSH